MYTYAYISDRSKVFTLRSNLHMTIALHFLKYKANNYVVE